MTKEQSELAFTGLLVSSVKVEEKENNIVEFDDECEVGDCGMFLTNIVEIKGKKVRTFQATKLTDAEVVKKFINSPPQPSKTSMTPEAWKEAFKDAIPLFCVHGFSVQPSGLFDNVEGRGSFKWRKETIVENFADPKLGGGKYYPVMVLWPCSQGYKNTYRADQKECALEAGEIFKKLVDCIPNNTFARKSLMMHSMGNHVVYNGACLDGTPDVQFDDIFMVSADVDFDAFDKNPKDKNYGSKKDRAKNFFGMLATGEDGKPRGKMHFIHNIHDRALVASAKFLLFTNKRIGRIGQRGVGMYYNRYLFFIRFWKDDKQEEKVHQFLWDYFVNVDCAHLPVSVTPAVKHSYQFDDYCIKYYSDPDNRRIKKGIGNSYTMMDP